MQPVGEWVVDGVDVRIVHQLGVPPTDPGDLVLAGELLGPRPVAGRHGDHGGTAGPAGRLYQGDRGDAGRPQDADSQHAGVTGRAEPGAAMSGPPARAFPQYGAVGPQRRPAVPGAA